MTERCQCCGWPVKVVGSVDDLGDVSTLHYEPIGLARLDRFRRALEAIQELSGGSQPYLSTVEAGLIWHKAHTALKLVDSEPADAVMLALAVADASVVEAEALEFAQRHLLTGQRPYEAAIKKRELAVAALRAARTPAKPSTS